jgi:hypothetical protein
MKRRLADFLARKTMQNRIKTSAAAQPYGNVKQGESLGQPTNG